MKHRGEQWERRLRLPAGSLCSAARMELCGNRRLVIEGFRDICAYTDEILTVNTDSGLIRLRGDHLCVEAFGNQMLAVEGQLLSIEFLS